MVTVFAEGLLPSVGVGCVEAAFAGAFPWCQRRVLPCNQKAAPTSCLSRDGGGGSAVLCGASYSVSPAFTSRCSYLPRYSAACMAMMRPELLAQEACEPGARETS